jgi:hypothetical protein
VAFHELPSVDHMGVLGDARVLEALHRLLFDHQTPSSQQPPDSADNDVQ